MLETVLNMKAPVTWEITDHGEYYIFKAMFTPSAPERNYYTGDGVIGYDKNYDHITWAEIDGKSNLLRRGEIPLDLEGKTAGQASKILEAAAIALGKSRNLLPLSEA
ncbi:MAG: hypothetical protein K6U74_11460 [Firmicutes bacterium]|nr:hypothetical protein [Bacillota bacterium]